MTNDSVRTWGEAFDYVWKVRWKRLPSAVTNKINAGHITSYAGRSLPLTRMGKVGWWLQLIADLQDEHPQWSTSTINRVISAGTTVLKTCNKAGLTSVQCPVFDRLKEGESRLTWFSKEQVDHMAHIAVDVYDRTDLADAILVSAYTGVRQGELLKLRSEDVDLDTNTLWVGGKPDRKTKGGEVRALPIHDRIRPILERRKGEPFKLLFGDDWNNKDQLFAAFKKVRNLCGITEDHVWHSLRHSFGTWLGEVTHPKQIQALMGHKQIETSLRYVKATDQAVRSAVSAL
jgi:integrase